MTILAEVKEAIKQAVHKTIPVKAEPITDDSLRIITFDASNETKDRDGEVIKASAWELDNYKKNPVVQFAHKYDEPPVGKSPGIAVVNGVLKLPVQFPPAGVYEFADIVYNLAKGGYLSAVSVGFIPKEFDRAKKEGDPSRTYTKVELLEVSIVPVPSNPDAIVSAREAGVITVKQFQMLSPEAKKPSQNEIKDQLDYTLSLIKDGNLNDDNKVLLKTINTEIERTIGNDMPINILSKSLTDTICMLDDHNKSHAKCYKACKEALSQMEAACNGGKVAPVPEVKEVIVTPPKEINMDEIIKTTVNYWRK